MNKKGFKKIMIFGRPGSGKSTYAHQLSTKLQIPLYHLDKHFFEAGWVEKNKDEFTLLLDEIVSKQSWIIDGNCIDSLETRWAQADIVLYFNFNKWICLWRLLKRRMSAQRVINDRAEGCSEVLKSQLIRYMWNFEAKVFDLILKLREKYSSVLFQEINTSYGLELFDQRF